MFKLYSKNIRLKELTEHNTWEHHQEDIKDDPRWAHVFALKEELIEEYKEHKRLVELGQAEFYKR